MTNQIANNLFGYIEEDFSTRKLTLSMGKFYYQTCITNFLILSAQIQKIDLDEMATNISDAFDFKTIKCIGFNKKFQLNLAEIVHLKELIEEAHFNLALSELLYKENIERCNNLVKNF